MAKAIKKQPEVMGTRALWMLSIVSFPIENKGQEGGDSEGMNSRKPYSIFKNVNSYLYLSAFFRKVEECFPGLSSTFACKFTWSHIYVVFVNIMLYILSAN